MIKDKKLIFISGSGRSGTHLIGRTIASHPEIVGRIEAKSTFRLITKIATTQDFKDLNNKLNLLKFRLKHILKTSDSHILEKSHPSLWLTDFFLNQFQEVKFILVYRDLEPVVSSMLEHEGILSWYRKLPQDKPNRFLGITDSNKNKFNNYSIEEKCAVRWQSHYNEIFRLHKKYPKSTYVLKYDDFLINPKPILKELSLFLGVSNTFSSEDFKINSLDKWKQKLSAEQLKKIRAVITN